MTATEIEVDALAGLEASLLADDLKRATGDAFRLFEARKDRGTGMSLSGLGGCSRVVAFRVAGVEPTDPDLDGDKKQATLGTWLHGGLLPMLRLKLRGARTEVPVTLSGGGLTLPGHVDVWWRRKSGGDVVDDVKSVKEYGLAYVRTWGPKQIHEDQVDGYALALRQTKGADVRWTSLTYVDRATGDHEVFVRPFGPREAARVMERLTMIARWRDDPLAAPRDEDGPGLSWLCDHCPWLKACWGPRAKPGDYSVVGLDPEEHDAIEAALEEYDAARAAIKEAEARQLKARALLDHARPGQYGEMALAWARNSPGGNIAKAGAWDALDKVTDLYEIAQEHGVLLPRTQPRRGNISVLRKGAE